MSPLKYSTKASIMNIKNTDKSAAESLISRSQLEYFSRILRRFGSVEELLVRADDADEVEG